jgi:hypothetical protein
VIDATADFVISEVHIDTMITNTNTMGRNITLSSTGEKDIKSKEMTDVLSYFMNRLSKNAVYAKIDHSGRVVEIVNAKMLSDVILKDTSSIALTGPSKIEHKKADRKYDQR